MPLSPTGIEIKHYIKSLDFKDAWSKPSGIDTPSVKSHFAKWSLAVLFFFFLFFFPSKRDLGSDADYSKFSWGLGVMQITPNFHGNLQTVYTFEIHVK